MIKEPLYSIPDRASDWPARIEAACQILERQFGVHLDKANPYHEGKPSIALEDRLAYLKKKAKTKTKWLSVSTGRGYQNTPTGWKNVDHYSIIGSSYANKGIYDCSALFPDVDERTHETLLVELGDALEAYSAQYTPVETAKRFFRIQWCYDFGTSLSKKEVPDLTAEEATLPSILGTWYAGLDSPFQPHWLGWLNYWSEDVADYLGFPDPKRDSDLLEHAYRTPKGAWLVKIGAAPLDATNPEHVLLVAEIYNRFPKLGARPKTEPRLFQRGQ